MTPQLHIVHIEDNVTDAELVREILLSEGIACEVMRVESESGLREALRAGGQDLVLADYTLPSFDGLSALKICQQEAPDLPFIFVSGTLGEEVAIEALKFGATDYVLKSSLRRLASSVRRAMIESAERSERRRAMSELHNAQEELARIARVTAMGELTASIAHEINQPLTAIIANGNTALRWLASGNIDRVEMQQTLGEMIQDAQRAHEILARVRNLVRRAEPEYTHVNVNEVIEEVVTVTRQLMMAKGVVTRLDLAQELPPVIGDPIQLQQVILNLILNGGDAMSAIPPEQPRLLAIESIPTDRAVRVAVRDTGVGLPEGVAGKIFDAFYTTKPEGMGIGLSISRTIVEAHGGQIWASPNPPQGAVFQFTIPTDREV